MDVLEELEEDEESGGGGMNVKVGGNDFQSSECAEGSWTTEARSGRADEKFDCRLSDQ
jgi:hypothetical protein